MIVDWIYNNPTWLWGPILVALFIAVSCGGLLIFHRLVHVKLHPGILLTNKEPSRAHVHSIVRTPNGNDYGADLLRLHYQHSHKGHRPGE